MADTDIVPDYKQFSPDPIAIPPLQDQSLTPTGTPVSTLLGSKPWQPSPELAGELSAQEEARKTKLEHQKEIAHLTTLGNEERRLLKAARERADELERRLKVAEAELVSGARREP